MSKPLVVVESPAKAKTISKFLGADYDVRASVGHVADLPSKGLNIDVDNGFKPTYELTERGKQVVKDLRAALKDASELYLATDEDREGEAISWHLVEYLKPKVPVKRMVFHEITKAAIDHAIDNPRGIDYGPRRRSRDTTPARPALRLRGLARALATGQPRPVSGARAEPVDPPDRRALSANGSRSCRPATGTSTCRAATEPAFEAKLVARRRRQGRASGKDFDDRGQVSAKAVALDEVRARALADGLDGATFAVRSVEEKPYRSSPRAPFMTSTLQQEGGRKLRLSSSQVMRVAQGLYERGFITYMRTDSVTLSDEAKKATRQAIESEYGANYLSPTPKVYTSKSKNAQEAHEAIRPTTPYRSPKAVEGELNSQELALYRLIWQRTLASQMADAAGVTVSVRLGAVSTHEDSDCEFSAAGTTITFPGYRAVYVASDADDGTREALLPPLAAGEVVPVESLTPNGHTTSPPARYTEASLVKRLEELEIGRPSTWASIIQTIQDRGYVWKKGQALVPDLDGVRRGRIARAALRGPRRLRADRQDGPPTSTRSRAALSRKTPGSIASTSVTTTT